MFCVLLGQITRWCANFYQDFPFSFASTCTLSFISKLNAGSILKVNVCVVKIGRHFGCGERGGSVVECRIPEREVGGSKPTAAVLCP